MNHGTGRNEACPCGSGKKYKKCCLNAALMTSDFAWRKLRQMAGVIMDEHLIPYVMKNLPKEMVEPLKNSFLRICQKQ